MAFFIVLIFIIFIPIPLKFSFKVASSEISLFLFSKEIKLKVNGNETKHLKRISHSFFHRPRFLNAANVISTIRTVTWKFKLKFSLKIEYGLDDAALTAITFGVINAASPFLYKSLCQFFKINSYTFKLQPNFDNTCFNLQIQSIFYFSLVKTIYMLCVLKKNYIFSKRHQAKNSTNI